MSIVKNLLFFCCSLFFCGVRSALRFFFNSFSLRLPPTHTHLHCEIHSVDVLYGRVVRRSVGWVGLPACDCVVVSVFSILFLYICLMFNVYLYCVCVAVCSLY